MKELFFSELKRINAGDEDFNFDSIEVYVNNHEFNDGEDTYFAVSYEEPDFYRDGVKFSAYGKEENEEFYEKAQEAFSEVFDKFENADGMFFERIFGDKNGDLKIKLK